MSSNDKVAATFHPDTQPAVPQDVISILESVVEERDRAMAKFGVQSHPDGTGGTAAEIIRDQQRELVDEQARKGKSTWRDILMEEVREAFAETDLVALDKELMQVQQVCLVWREHIARRQRSPLLTKAVTVSARSLVDAQSIAADEGRMRELAAKWQGETAMRSLGSGGRPGRQWMLDTINRLLIVAGGNDHEELVALKGWVKALPSSWWDHNLRLNDGPF